MWRSLPILLLAVSVERPFIGITHITRTETAPRAVTMHLVKVDLTAPGIAFKLSPPGGSRETMRQTTLQFLQRERAQVAINAHFFLPFPSTDRDANVIGLAASNGVVYSEFEAPQQSYAIVAHAPAINIDSCNRAALVRAGQPRPVLWNALAGSAQIITNGVKSIPAYRDAQTPDGLLTPGGGASYSNSHSWYHLPRARTAIGISRDGRTLFLFTVDERGGAGMTVGEVADVLLGYGVYNALNLDGGGSTSLAMEDPRTHERSMVNAPSDPGGRAVASSLAVFAKGPATEPGRDSEPPASAVRCVRGKLVLVAADNPGGSGVREIRYSTGGRTRVIRSSRASLSAHADVLYLAADHAGNFEPPKSVSVPPCLCGQTPTPTARR